MAEHKQVKIEAHGWEAEVDEGIADLIRELWKADIETLLSCQDNVPRGHVWIQFASAYDAEHFLNIVTKDFTLEGQSLYNRIHGRWDGIKNTWRYSVGLADFGLIEDIQEDDTIAETHTGKAEFQLEVSVRFPHADYQAVLERMIEHNTTPPQPNPS